MSGQTRYGEAGTNRFPGLSRSSRGIRPTSVPTITVAAGVSRARRIMAEVEPMKSASAWTAGEVSGWTITSAPGWAARAARTSAAVRAWWTGQQPVAGTG